MDTVTAIVTIVSTLGGWEMIKYFLNRKSNKRISEAEADAVEFGVLKETLSFLQEQLRDKEERFSEQTERLRKTQDEYFSVLQEYAQSKLDAQKYKCERPNCQSREPQNGY